ncbi:putative PurR-regulated permease PerM/methylmalonyl-CoA mutase cobalamin-binding subunit [Rhodoligotrophos appendicifer]|uniref:AI-2E family transporter n=1 Tax=Rhodoligotrophos appendicifer TaxID=987056 RepID=UPI001186E199|nr:AI-2E family transporter [Rhodoligotrophos appendicifer]
MSDPTAAPIERPSAPGSSVLTAAGILVVIVALYFGSDIFIPFTLAILLAFALTPIVNWLRRLRVPRVIAVMMAVSMAFMVIGGISLTVGSQLVQLAENLPTYQTTMRQKLQDLKLSGDGHGILDRLKDTFHAVTEDLSKPAETPGSTASRDEGPQAIPVIIESGDPKPLELLQAIGLPLIKPLAMAGIVIVFVIFVLLERDDLRDRFIKLVGRGDLQKSTEALNEAANRVSRYLLMQVIINLTYGIPIGVGLYLIGIPNAILWGLLAAILRFIPYLGPFLAALLPMAMAFAVDPGWSMLIWAAALFVVIELISNNVMEPWLYGASTGLSSLAIIMAAIFWTTLWGPIGLVLATPLTVCLIVIGRYVPHLDFLSVLLGSDPVLAPEERMYQRLLAGNSEEALEIAERYVEENSALSFYDQVALPALRIAEDDRQRNAGDLVHRRRIADGVVMIMQEIAEQEAGEEVEPEDEPEAADAQSTPARPANILCIGGRTELDRAASEIVSQVLADRGIASKVLAPMAVSQDAINQLELTGVDVVCLSYLTSRPQVFARYVCRRLKRRAPQLKIVVCFWNADSEAAVGEEAARKLGADALATTLNEAAQQIAAAAPQVEVETLEAPPIPENEQERLDALRQLGLTRARGAHFDALARRVADAFDTPIALVSVIDEEDQLWPGAVGLPEDLEASRKAVRALSICGHVVAANEVVVIPDVAKDARCAQNPFLLEKGIRFYAGAPLRSASGYPLGSLCVIDTKPRRFSARDRKLLQLIADELMSQVEAEYHRKHAAEGGDMAAE